MNKNNKDESIIPEEVKKGIKYAVYAVIVIIAVSVFFSSFYIVNPGERGVLLTLGKPDLQAQEEGFHWKYPFVQSVVLMDVKTQKYDAKASAASSDLQVVSTDIAVNFHINPTNIVYIYKEIGADYGTKVIQPAVQEVVKASTAKFTAEELIKKREAVKELIDNTLRERLLSQNIIMETTSITNFDFSAEFNKAIEQKVTMEQQSLTEKNRLSMIEFQAKQKVAEAEGNSKSQILMAEAQAKQKLLIAESEAKALELQKNVISEDLLKLRQIEVQKAFADKWNGALPNYNLGGNALPILNIPMNNIVAGALNGGNS